VVVIAMLEDSLPTAYHNSCLVLELPYLNKPLLEVLDSVGPSRLTTGLRKKV
jgi:hypothetical protein